METARLKKFAQAARSDLRKQVETKLAQVLDESSAARRENPQAVVQLEKQIREISRERLIDKVAYTWFNRFCALRFMDVNGYTRIRVVSSSGEAQVQPEILAEAKMGHIDEDRVPERSRQQIADLLSGNAPSYAPEQEAYRLLLVAECNSFHEAMPYLFERIADYTELLMPDDLLSANSILAATREAMTPDACQDVEVIGWLYQFYISEKKDQVFEGLKKNQKITPENIPAATQLFTPHWIVRYLVENSLGRLWMLNHPDSPLVGRMEYYIKPEQPETDFLKIEKPEDIKVCDPACGSGHMLTYAFDLLYAIYEEVGTDPGEIPEKILTHNLYGIELDERAGELAAFALTMKARTKLRRFFNKGIKPNICVLEKVQFSSNELDEYMVAVGRDLFSVDLRVTLNQFAEADSFGSLIRPKLTSVQNVLSELEAKDLSSNLFLKDTHDRVLTVLRQADYLTKKYQVVVANPPYMGARNMSGRLGVWLKDNYEDVKSDLFSAFVVRCGEICVRSGFVGVMCPNVWMYISTHELLRSFLVNEKTLTNLVELPLSGFKGATVQICAYNFENRKSVGFEGGFVRLTEFKGGDDEMAEFVRVAVRNPDCGWFYRASSSEFGRVSGSPIAYWMSKKIRDAFGADSVFETYAAPRQGLGTTNNDLFVKSWPEVSYRKISFKCANKVEAMASGGKWFPYSKGGGYRKWFGNDLDVVNWGNDGLAIREALVGKNPNIPRSEVHYFKEGITWGLITSASFSARFSPVGGIFDVGGSKAFPSDTEKGYFLGLLNSKLSGLFLKSLNPTLNFQVGDLKRIPVKDVARLKVLLQSLVGCLVDYAKNDWDSFETSWGFKGLPLLRADGHQSALADAYQVVRTRWKEATLEMQRLEEENNHIFIEAYGLQGELTAEVLLSDITLNCNPYYRYGSNKMEDELEALLLADTMREFLSYAVGCMFGRYSLDKPGLVLANQRDTLADFLRQVPEPSFMPDEDNVIPLLDGEWFADDVTERLRQFLRVTFGDDHYEENLAFIEAALSKDIRKYFLKDFYADHVKRYKKRPIYWLFSSPKGTFSALVYLHRYRPDTVSVVLQYLRDFRKKLAARLDYLQQVGISTFANQGEKTKANKESETIRKQLLELDDYERDTLYPLATEQLRLDLDDGVKVNYLKLGAALKKIVGLDAKED